MLTQGFRSGLLSDAAPRLRNTPAVEGDRFDPGGFGETGVTWSVGPEKPGSKHVAALLLPKH